MATFSTAVAQVSPAHWKFNVKELSPEQVELQFKLKLDDGWHIYSQKSDPNGPIPSEYTFEAGNEYKRIGGVVEPKPHEEMDDIFKCIVRSFSGSVTFRQKIERKTDKAFEVKGSMYYQLCNDGSCIAPDDTPFSFKVPAVSDATPRPDNTETVMDSLIEEPDTATLAQNPKEENTIRSREDKKAPGETRGRESDPETDTYITQTRQLHGSVSRHNSLFSAESS